MKKNSCFLNASFIFPCFYNTELKTFNFISQATGFTVIAIAITVRTAQLDLDRQQSKVEFAFRRTIESFLGHLGEPPSSIECDPTASPAVAARIIQGQRGSKIAA